MTKNIEKLVELTKNKELVLKFEENLHTFTCYDYELRNIFDEAVKIRDNINQLQ